MTWQVFGIVAVFFFGLLVGMLIAVSHDDKYGFRCPVGTHLAFKGNIGDLYWVECSDRESI